MSETTTHPHPAGLTWTETGGMQRSWHALAADGRVWLVDPVDAADTVERAATLGELAGVIQLLDRHSRDGKAIAECAGVPLHRLPTELPGTPFTPFAVVDVPKWREVALWWAAQRTLVVPEAVGTGALFAVGDGPVGVHPMLRAFGVGKLRHYDPELLLAGHGAPVEAGAGAALHEALGRSRGDLPKLVKKIPSIVRPG